MNPALIKITIVATMNPTQPSKLPGEFLEYPDPPAIQPDKRLKGK
jgi:hypothetical protein